MGIAEFFSEILDSLPWPQDVHAEAPADEEDESKDESKDEGEGESEDKSEDKEEGGEESGEGGDDAEEGGDDEEEEEEDEEEEEEEPEDPKPKLEEECAKSAGCIGYKHHYQECVERVTAQQEDESYKGPKEDCVEEFFHLQHCATQCAAPKLFKMLK
ncbi:Cytochrome b-c1 complex subunit 6, mitochondrial [Exophiala xenobiotica]|uniref:Cytochrome b-c1 complex subunit 6, mitochondrial n=1 Tax=Lithohypha guttulata TaxID=1690604 RepID=A0ABR0K5R5_9EURO|nr:Cytochrome b-c1 complex subunit 6, mitochondrial [Lithohypha guttulata]KAK5324316.1 Cytochrome b-c1 complex subunit 6, mitochondrial [Exophiala xenobiotica]